MVPYRSVALDRIVEIRGVPSSCPVVYAASAATSQHIGDDSKNYKIPIH